MGHSLGVRLPRALVDDLGPKPGDELEVVAAKSTRIEVVKDVRRAQVGPPAILSGSSNGAARLPARRGHRGRSSISVSLDAQGAVAKSETARHVISV